jgi:hypothetical protein
VESYLPWITGSGGALVILALWVYAFFAGKIHSDRDFSKLEADNKDLRAANDRLQEALGLERQRSDAVAQAGGVTNQLISGLVKLATEHREAEAHEHSDAAHDHQVAADKADARALTALDLTAKDLGL